MLYILNVILPTKKNFKNSITALYGIGQVRAKKLASILGLHPYSRIEQVSQRQLNNLGQLIERAFLIDFELRRKISLNITSLRKIRTFRGYCHSHGLPTRGQRTHTNASTAHKLAKKAALTNSQYKRTAFNSFYKRNNRSMLKNKSNTKKNKKNNKK